MKAMIDESSLTAEQKETLKSFIEQRLEEEG